MVSDFPNGTTANPGYPAAGYDANGYQYGPRIYDLAGLAKIPGLAFVNRTVTVAPGEELGTIRETQRHSVEGASVPASFAALLCLFGL